MKDAPKAASAELAPASAAVTVLAYIPELGDPELLRVKGGDLVVALPYEEKFLTLTPGNNTIDQEMWERVKTVPLVESLLDQHLIEEIDLSGATISDSPAAGITAIKGVEMKAALRLIYHSREAEQLQRWHDADSRVAIRNACLRRIAEITGGDA